MYSCSHLYEVFHNCICQVCQVCWDPFSQYAEVHHHTSGNFEFPDKYENGFDTMEMVEPLDLVGDSFSHICYWIHGPFAIWEGGQ